MPRYVMDLLQGNRLLLGRQFDAPDDVDAIAQATAVFPVDVTGDPRITGYRLRNPVPGADRIFHRADRPKLINARESDERVLNKPSRSQLEDARYTIFSLNT